MSAKNFSKRKLVVGQCTSSDCQIITIKAEMDDTTKTPKVKVGDVVKLKADSTGNGCIVAKVETKTDIVHGVVVAVSGEFCQVGIRGQYIVYLDENNQAFKNLSCGEPLFGGGGCNCTVFLLNKVNLNIEGTLKAGYEIRI